MFLDLGFGMRLEDRRVFLAARDHAVLELGRRDQRFGPRKCPEVRHLPKVVNLTFGENDHLTFNLTFGENDHFTKRCQYHFTAEARQTALSIDPCRVVRLSLSHRC